MKEAARLKKAAERYGTPAYIYDREVLRTRCRTLREGFPGFSIQYAVKANSNPAAMPSATASRPRL